MAYVLPPDGEVFNLAREDFTVLRNEDTGRYELVNTNIAVELSCESYCDALVDWIFRDIEVAEALDT